MIVPYVIPHIFHKLCSGGGPIHAHVPIYAHPGIY